MHNEKLEMRNCEAIDEVLKRTSPAWRCTMPKASKPSSMRDEAPRRRGGGFWRQQKQPANNLNNNLLFNTNIHKPSMMLGKVLKCMSLEKRCTVAKASKPLPISRELLLKFLDNLSSPENPHILFFTKTMKTLLLISSFQDNWLVLMAYARKQVYVIYHQHQPSHFMLWNQ